MRQALFQIGAEMKILVQVQGIVPALEIPAGFPCPVVADAEAVRMRFLTHGVSYSFDSNTRVM